MKLAIVGITGLVGGVILKVLKEHNFKIDQLIPVASQKSVGKPIVYNGDTFKIVSIDDALDLKPDIALFSAGSTLSIAYAEKFAKIGCFVIDNSSAWRMDEAKKLIIPEVNGEQITINDKIIANPNCSTIQMLLPLAPLHEKYAIKRIVVSTYQSISGSGQAAIKQFEDEQKGLQAEKVYPHRIDRNCLPQCDDFLENDYTKEEMKMVNETHKILNDKSIGVSATAVRVPVTAGHSESINIEFHEEFKIEDIQDILSKTKGVTIQDIPSQSIYPMPINAENKDDVFVGRIRKDPSQKNTINLWVVADNLRKGAATNAVQIAELLIKNKIINQL